MSTNLELQLHAPEPAAASVLLDIRYGQVGLLQVRVRTLDPGVLLDELTGRVAAAPHFFHRTPVGLDLSLLEAPPEVGQVRDAMNALRRAGMLAVGLSGDGDAVETVAAALNLPRLPELRAPKRPVPVVQAVPELRAAESESAPQETVESPPKSAAPPSATPASAVPTPETADSAALVAAHTVRSGQRLYARGRDLVVTAAVSAGAEVMADGCVHVYGALRGRAMAGVHGEQTARVFCHQFYAELVAIAGVFRVFETIPAELAGRSVQAWLEGEELRFARLGE